MKRTTTRAKSRIVGVILESPLLADEEEVEGEAEDVEDGAAVAAEGAAYRMPFEVAAPGLAGWVAVGVSAADEGEMVLWMRRAMVC